METFDESDAKRTFLRILDAALTDVSVEFLENEERHVVGRGMNNRHVAIQVNNARLFQRILRSGNLGLGEAYMAGDFDIRQGSLEQFLTLLSARDIDKTLTKCSGRLRPSFGNTPLNVAHLGPQTTRDHYSQDDKVFEAFLDSTLTYSCGYAETGYESIEGLQKQKLLRICQKLCLGPGDTLLDIGCGFGSLLICAAERFGVSGVGLTTSHNQYRRACEEISRRGLSDRIKLIVATYGAATGTFDKVVSVGMMEHVPQSEYGSYCRTLANVLRPGGIGLVHTVGSHSSCQEPDPFIERYIFAGWRAPCLSDITKSMEDNQLMIVDVENMIRHLYYTSVRWLENFRENSPALAKYYSDTFVRMWEYYLSCGVAAALTSRVALYQVLFSNGHTGTLPLRRI